MDSWRRLKFEPEVDLAYSQYLLDRSVFLSRVAYPVAIFTFVAFQAWDLLLDPHALSKTGPLRLASVLHLSICFGLTYLPAFYKNPNLWLFLISYTYCGYVILLTLIFAQLPGGFVAGVGGWVVGMIFVPFITNGAVQALGILLPFLAVALLTIALSGGTTFELVNALAWTGSGVGFAAGFAYLLDVINRQAFHLARMLETERQRSEALLLNILPAAIAARLKAREEPLADNHECVSVLFADLAGFSRISRTMSANDLVVLLNDLFSRFDRLVERHGAEKIKTIGDAYMVATGLTGSLADHAERIADLALGMQQAFAEFRTDNKVDLKLRIGVHSGAVIAGVIGRQKFSYDLWGDTVNIASRMESEGIADQIQISAETWKMLPDRYRTAPRGEIQIKGHSPRATFLLQGCGQP